MANAKTRLINGGMKDDIGIAQEVKQSSTEKNDRERPSQAGKYIKTPDNRI